MTMLRVAVVGGGSIATAFTRHLVALAAEAGLRNPIAATSTPVC
jgi:hypothetical protein